MFYQRDLHTLDCEQSLFFFRFRKGIDFLKVVRMVFWSGVVGPGTNFRSLARSSRETRETKASPVSRLQSRAWSFACLGRFARRTKKKERLLVVYSHSTPVNLLTIFTNVVITAISFNGKYNGLTIRGQRHLRPMTLPHWTNQTVFSLLSPTT